MECGFVIVERGVGRGGWFEDEDGGSIEVEDE
jgi:hypothetical protein